MNFLTFFFFFFLRAPTLGSMLMCLTSALVGVIAVLRKRSLIGEALSHASYPGVVISVVLASTFFPTSEKTVSIAILLGAFCISLLGLQTIELMEKRLRVNSDAALCFVLSTFLGIGILIASRIQISHALWYKQIQIFLYGQAATMTDIHIWIYGMLAFITLCFVFFLFPQIKILTFDRLFANSVGMKGRLVDFLSFVLLVLAIVIGIRSVGVVMMSGMLIAPAVAARQFTNRLSLMFWFAALFGLLSGFFGNYLSVQLPTWLSSPDRRSFYLPTGPMIILVAGAICFTSLLFAPKRGVLFRALRILRFNYQCLLENTLKSLWKFGVNYRMNSKELKTFFGRSPILFPLTLFRLQRQGYIERTKGYVHLTLDGEQKARQLVRLHRLWEVYLFSYLGVHLQKVHASAEEMEHIITSDLEKKLTEFLDDPKKDPHHQPIPEGGGI